jgi:bacteriocin biosynthesis cyclodehydratase domain-containing protein
VSAAKPPDEPTLGPATRMLWRSPDSVHLELGSRAVVVAGLPTSVVRRVGSPLPPRGVEPEMDAAAEHAIETLLEAGYLWPRTSDQDDPRLAPGAPRLAGELAALAVQHGEAAAAVLAARRGTSVEIAGRSRVAAHLAAILAAAGIGRVHCSGDGVARLCHMVPGGVTLADEGSVLAAATEAALRRAAPEVDCTPLPVGSRADLTVLAVDGPMPDDRLSALHATDAPYLVVTLSVDAGVVGPLVLPGLTSCPRCADRHRGDRDSAWSALAVQLTVGRRHGPASAVSVATITAGVAAQQALAFLDGGEPDCIDGTIELCLPDWRLRRRTWLPHPDCGCAGVDDVQP